MTTTRMRVGTPVFGGDRFVRGCTGKQAAFINRLLDERVYDEDVMYSLTGIRKPERAEDINIRAASDVINFLLRCPKNASAPVRLATERQVAYLVSLAASRQGGPEALASTPLQGMTFDTASNLITTLKAAPEKQPEIEVGAYRYNGTMYSVRRSQMSGRLYGVHWVVGGWSNRDYNVVRYIKPSDRLTLEDAREFGVMTGCCCHCGRTLTDQKSVLAGIGPVCAQYYARYA